MKRSEVKHLIKEIIQDFLKESMNVHIAGADYDKTETLGELSNKLIRPVWDYISKLPEDQVAYFQKNKMPELLTADGDGYFESTGTLNLYLSGLTTVSTRNVLKIILQGLKKLKIPYGPLKKEQSGRLRSEVIRIPIPKNPLAGTYAGPPELNLSNVNAYQIFHHVLQYEGEHEFSMDAEELLERIKTLAHDQGWIDQNTIKSTDSNWPDAERDTQDVENPHLDMINKAFGGGGKEGPRIIGGGLDADRIKSRLAEIAKIAKWAIDHGHSKIYVA